MAKLAKTVWVKDPERPGLTVRLDAGQEVPKHLEAAVTNEDAWEDGELPAAAKKAAEPESTPETSAKDDDREDTKPAAKKSAATRPARGRKSAADEGDGS